MRAEVFAGQRRRRDAIKLEEGLPTIAAAAGVVVVLEQRVAETVADQPQVSGRERIEPARTERGEPRVVVDLSEIENVAADASGEIGDFGRVVPAGPRVPIEPEGVLAGAARVGVGGAIVVDIVEEVVSRTAVDGVRAVVVGDGVVAGATEEGVIASGAIDSDGNSRGAAVNRIVATAAVIGAAVGARDQRVVAVIALHVDVGGGGIDAQEVIAGAAIERVAPGATRQSIVAGFPVEDVVATAADEAVVAGAALEVVVAGTAVDGVVAVLAVNGVVAAAGVDAVMTVTGRNDVVAVIADDGVIIDRAVQRVVASGADDQIAGAGGGPALGEVRGGDGGGSDAVELQRRQPGRAIGTGVDLQQGIARAVSLEAQVALNERIRGVDVARQARDHGREVNDVAAAAALEVGDVVGRIPGDPAELVGVDAAAAGERAAAVAVRGLRPADDVAVRIEEIHTVERVTVRRARLRDRDLRESRGSVIAEVEDVLLALAFLAAASTVPEIAKNIADGGHRAKRISDRSRELGHAVRVLDDDDLADDGRHGELECDDRARLIRQVGAGVDMVMAHEVVVGARRYSRVDKIADARGLIQRVGRGADGPDAFGVWVAVVVVRVDRDRDPDDRTIGARRDRAEGVVTKPAAEAVGAMDVDQSVVAVTADDCVVANAAVERIGADTAAGVDQIVADFAQDCVVAAAGPGDDGVVAGAAEDGVVARARRAFERVVASTAEDRVIAGRTVDGVVAIAGIDGIIAGVAIDAVIAGRAEDRLIGGIARDGDARGAVGDKRRDEVGGDEIADIGVQQAQPRNRGAGADAVGVDLDENVGTVLDELDEAIDKRIAPAETREAAQQVADIDDIATGTGREVVHDIDDGGRVGGQDVGVATAATGPGAAAVTMGDVEEAVIAGAAIDGGTAVGNVDGVVAGATGHGRTIPVAADVVIIIADGVIPVAAGNGVTIVVVVVGADGVVAVATAQAVMPVVTPVVHGVVTSPAVDRRGAQAIAGIAAIVVVGRDAVGAVAAGDGQWFVRGVGINRVVVGAAIHRRDGAAVVGLVGCQRIGTRAAGDADHALIGGDRVIVGAAVERRSAVAGAERVRADAAAHGIGRVAAGNGIVAVAAEHGVRAVGIRHLVIAGAGVDGVVADPTVDAVVAVAGIDRIVTAAGTDRVVAVAAGDAVVATGP